MSTRRRSFRRLLLRTLLAAILLLLIIAAVAYFSLTHYASRPPDWWQPPSPTDPATIDTAKAVENGVTTLLHEHRPPSQTWTMQLSEHDANAWLAARLKDWFENQSSDSRWPSEVTAVLLKADRGSINLGVRTLSRGSANVLSVALVPRIDTDGSLWLPARSFHVGQLAVPSAWALRAADSPLRRVLPPAIERSSEFGSILGVLAGDEPLTRSPILKLSDGRRVHVTGIAVELGQIFVTCRAASATSPP